MIIIFFRNVVDQFKTNNTIYRILNVKNCKKKKSVERQTRREIWFTFHRGLKRELKDGDIDGQTFVTWSVRGELEICSPVNWKWSWPTTTPLSSSSSSPIETRTVNRATNLPFNLNSPCIKGVKNDCRYPDGQPSRPFAS